MKMFKNYIYIALIGLILTSCTNQPVLKDTNNKPIRSERSETIIVGASMPAPKPTVSYDKSSYEIKNFIIHRSFLLSNEKVDINLVNFVYLPKKPITDIEIEQYETVCKIWLNSFPTEVDLKPYLDNTKDSLVPLYWPLTKKINNINCKELIDNYDYARMNIYTKHNKLNTNKLQLIAEYKSIFVTMDLSNINNIDDLILGFNIWKDNMCKVPSKNTKLEVKSLVNSVRKVLGTLGSFITTKNKG